MIEVVLCETHEKIEDICRANKLRFEFAATKFPIVARFKHATDGQLDIFSEGEPVEPTMQYMEFIFADDLVMEIENGFTIEDATLTKLKNYCKKLHYAFLQRYFKEAKQQEARQ